MRQCGTCSAYNGGCRCVLCRAAVRDYGRVRAAVKRGLAEMIPRKTTIKHGTAAAYTRGACRCKACSAAQHVYRARYYAGHATPEKESRMDRYWLSHTRTRRRSGSFKRPLRLMVRMRSWLRDAGYLQCSSCRTVKLLVEFSPENSICRPCRREQYAVARSEGK